jgi:phosphate transport system permease protein
LATALGGLAFAIARLSPRLRARHAVERLATLALIACSVVAVLTTVGIVLSLISESLRFFARIPPSEFFFGLTWSPQTAIRAEQIGASGAFGAVPLFAGTLLISAIALLTCVPLGLMAAVWMAEYAPSRVRNIAKPALEILAGIPSVVYGFFAMLTVAPLVREFGTALGLEVAAQSALAAGIVMGVMIIPNVSSLSDDVIRAVPMSLREGSLAIGATRAETVMRVVLPAALPGIVAAVILAFSRALGETMIVVMAAGLAANITANPLDAVTTVTVHIAMLLVGDQEFDSAKTLSAFALGLLLFFVTLTLNVIALHLARRYRERYE